MARRSRSRSRSRSRTRSHKHRTRTRSTSRRRHRITKRTRSRSGGRRKYSGRAGHRQVRPLSRRKYNQRGGGSYGTSAALDYGNYSGGGISDYGGAYSQPYSQPYGQNPYVGYGGGMGETGESNESSVSKLSQSISSVIADLRAKLRKNAQSSSYNNSASGQSSYSQPTTIPKHYGGYHRSSFLNKLRRR